MFIPGDRIKLVSMPYDPDPIPVGTEGTVTFINKLTIGYQVVVAWDNNRSLLLSIPPDVAVKI